MTGVVTEQVFRLYRIYGDDGALLYVGESNDTLRRFVEHLKDQRWAAEVADHRRDPRVFYSKADVQATEKEAVERERPRFNIEYNQRNPDRVDPRTMRYPDGRLYRPDVYHQPGVAAPVRRERAAAKTRPAQSPARGGRRRGRSRRRAFPGRPLGLLVLWLALVVAFWWAAARHGVLHGWEGPRVGLRNASVLWVVVWFATRRKRRRR